MKRTDITNWASEFALSLEVGGERVPFDRVIAAHLQDFVELRDAGLTWPAIAGILTKAGARRKDGGPISPDQLRAVVSRHLRRTASTEKATPRVEQPMKTVRRMDNSNAQTSALKAQTAYRKTVPIIFDVSPNSDGSKDISALDISAALACLKQK